jgi:hypothetical protein
VGQLVNITKVDALIDHFPLDSIAELIVKLRSVKKRDNVDEFNLWDETLGDPTFQTLKEKFLSMGNELMSQNSNTRSTLNLERAWINRYKDGEYIAPHHHGSSFMIGILYLYIDEDGGDLLIQDPLIAYSWKNIDDKRRFGNCRASIPITPVTGMMVVMPGFLIHSSEPKPAGKQRIVLSTNFSAT